MGMVGILDTTWGWDSPVGILDTTWGWDSPVGILDTTWGWDSPVGILDGDGIVLLTLHGDGWDP